MKKLDPEKELVIGRDHRRGGQLHAYYCESSDEAEQKEQDLKSRGLPVLRRGTVRNILGA